MRIRGSDFPTLTWIGFCLASLGTHSAAQQPPAPQPTTPNIQINVNRVLVPVVVRDKQGRTVDNLKQEDFQVLDQGKPRPLSGFTVQRRGANETAAANTTECNQSSPAPTNAATQLSVLPDRITVFLFDDMHLSPEDLSYAKQAGTKALDGALTGSDVAAVVSTSGKTNSGLTRDHAILQNAIAAVQLHGTNQFQKSDCPYISYYQADLMLNEHDNHAVQDALAQVLNCDPGINPQTDLPTAQRLAEQAARRALSAGEQDSQATYAVFADRVRRHTGLAFLGSFPTGDDSFDRRFGVTTDLRLVPATKVKPDTASPFHGLAIHTVDELPFAWVRAKEAQQACTAAPTDPFFRSSSKHARP